MVKKADKYSPAGLSRKAFIKNAAWTLVGTAIAPTLLKARAADVSGLDSCQNSGDSRRYVLKNVRLETGFEYREGEVVATQTGLFCVEIQGKKILSVKHNEPDATAVDAEGRLMLPAFRDMHIHLDKTFYGDKWQAVRRLPGGVKGMIQLEQEILPDMLKNSVCKAGKLIELLQSKGSAFARSHVNIEPTSKLLSLRHLQAALDDKKQRFGAELVAFPQHGVFYTDTAPYMREAAKAGIDFIGGVDPYTVDGAIERTMDFTVGLALEFDKGIDIHLHETGDSGLRTVDYLIKKVEENPKLKGKTYLSHCFCLARLDQAKQQDIALKLAAAQIGIVSTIPFGGLIMPIPTLLKHKVKVMTGNDSIIDHWSTFGTGSVLEKAHLAAQLYGKRTEFDLSRMLALATAGRTPLDDKGVRIWPAAGDPSDFILMKASCSAEAVARISPVKSLYYQGYKVF